MHNKLSNNDELVDYKIMCFNGKPEFVQLCFDRDERLVAQHATFSFDWNQLYYTVNEKKSDVTKPKSLDQMIMYAKALSQDFPYVRVDFYDINGECKLSELTFTPFGNMLDFYTKDALMVLGAKLTLPKKFK